MYRYVLAFLVVLLVAGHSLPARPDTTQPFRFESFISLDDMQQFIVKTFPLGTSRDSLRHTFVDEGKATLKLHRTQAGVEKYIYDINLCGYYVWRWNISADYDASGHLQQAYLNANPLFQNGTPKRVIPAVPGRKASIFKASRPRPEAAKGESALAFMLLDRDSDIGTTDDQSLIGAGPSRADPLNMGKMITYSDVEPWRSIFDADDADHIAPYQGDCAAVDKQIPQLAK